MATTRHDDAASPRDEELRDEGSREGRPGADGGGAGPRGAGRAEALLDDVQVLLNGLVAFPRTLRLYPSHHQRILKHAERLERLVHRMLASSGGMLELRVRADEVYANEILLDRPEQLLAEFALLLRSRAVRALVFHRGVEAKEFTAVGEWFAHVPEGSTATDTQATLDAIAHPRLDIVLVGSSQSRPPRAGGAPAIATTPEYIGPEYPEPEYTEELGVVVHDVLSQPAIRRRMERMGSRLARLEKSLGGRAVKDVVVSFLGAREWATYPPPVLEATVRGLLGRAGEVAEGGAGAGADTALETAHDVLEESLEAALAAADAQAGLFRSSSMLFADASRNEIAYEKLDLDELAQHGMPSGEQAHDDLAERYATHCATTAALLVEGELALGAGEARAAPRRRRLEETLARRDLPAEGVARALSALHAAESREGDAASGRELVRELAACLGCHEALAALMDLLASDPDDARALAERLAARADAFEMLTGLMQMSLPMHMRQLVADAAVRQARTRIEAWSDWCFQNPRTVLNEYVFGVLLLTAPDLLEPVAERLLAKGSPEHRRELVRRLAENGGEAALELLLGEDGETRTATPDALVIEALGGFRHERAVAALCAVVRRCNDGAADHEDARRALHALKRIGTKEADAFLDEVVSGRRGLFHRYKKKLRAAAGEAREGKWSPWERT